MEKSLTGYGEKYYSIRVVVATTKVCIFKQITTNYEAEPFCKGVLLLPQRYTFQANHNGSFDVN